MSNNMSTSSMKIVWDITYILKPNITKLATFFSLGELWCSKTILNLNINLKVIIHVIKVVVKLVYAILCPSWMPWDLSCHKSWLHCRHLFSWSSSLHKKLHETELSTELFKFNFSNCYLTAKEKDLKWVSVLMVMCKN